MPTREDAVALDEADPLGAFRARFLPVADDGVVAYLDGNSLGRPPAATLDRITEFIRSDWGTGLIRGWSRGWWDEPTRIGDLLGTSALGAGPGQVVLGESTTVWLYKLLRGAMAARPDRTEIVIGADEFPTDRYVVEGIARASGRTIRWLETNPDTDLTEEMIADVLNDRTAVVVASHISYRSARIADMVGITQRVHEAGALMLWDLSHSAGVLPVALDVAGVDLAVGCTYKFLCGGPGAPAFCYVRSDLQADFQQPIQGWVGRVDRMEMGPGYQPAMSIERMLSGTPPILSLAAVDEGVRMIAEAGIDRIRAKSVALTEFAIGIADEWLLPLGFALASPRDAAHRGGHVTVRHPAARRIVADLTNAGVLADFRAPDGIRLGLAPLSTGFAELWDALAILRRLAEQSAQRE